MNSVSMSGGGVSVKTTKYVNFKGVDLTADPTNVSDSRSPHAPNLIADSGGFPEKRIGWRTLNQLESPINGLHYTVIDGEAVYIAHGGTKLYKWSEPDLRVTEHVIKATDELINSGHMQMIKLDMAKYRDVSSIVIDGIDGLLQSSSMAEPKGNAGMTLIAQQQDSGDYNIPLGFMIKYGLVEVTSAYSGGDSYVKLGTTTAFSINQRDESLNKLLSKQGVENGLKYLRIRFEGNSPWSPYNVNNLVWELTIYENGVCVLIMDKLNTTAIGARRFFVPGKGSFVNLTLEQGKSIVFMPKDENGMNYDVLPGSYKGVQYLISDGEQYYTILDGALHPISITAPLTATKFKQYGTGDLPSGELLKGLSKPFVYMWSDAPIEKRLNVTVTAGKPSKVEVIKTGVANTKSTAFTMNKKLWILTGSEYLIYDGEQVKAVSETAFIPTTVIARAPNGGGEPYESVNLLQAKRKNAFLADGKATVYQLDTEGLDSTAIKITVNDVTMTENAHFTVNRTTGRVTFATVPQKPPIAGQDNVIIEFSKTVQGYAKRIENCTVTSMYGVGTNDRVFLSGNGELCSTDWHSGLNDPSYFPDINYSLVGNENTKIMGYSRIGEYQLIIKEDNSQDSTIFLRSATLDNTFDNNEVNAVFPLKQGVSGVGAISKYSVATLLDEPLFLSRNGIYAITSNTITAERTVQNRSYFVDPKLTKEIGLENAICAEWNGRYICCVNGRCYILDGKQDKTYKSESNGAYIYECYYWDNVPANCFMEYKGNLYFGTSDGRICRFNTDVAGIDKYSDDGKAISCCWTTKADDDGDFMRTKSIVKKGCGLMIKPYARSSCKVLIRTNKDFGVEVLNTPGIRIFDFNDIDFENFLFNTNDGPQIIPIKARVKRYITAQIIVKNDVVNEGFGIFGIIKRFTVGNYVK